MKQIILILLLSFSVTVNAQQRIKKCTVVKTEKIGPHKIKVIKKRREATMAVTFNDIKKKKY